MTIHRSNRLEALAEALCEVLGAQAPQDPVTPEWVVVASPGMQRWVLMQVAQRLGIAANLQFLFPNEAVSTLAAAVLGGDGAHWDSNRVAWALLDLFPDLESDERFAGLLAYLGARPQGPVARRELSLACCVADLFDRYLVHRRELVLDWEAGQDPSDWQAELWRRVLPRMPAPHPARRMANFFEEIEKVSEAPEGLPKRLCVFGVSTLPPDHLRAFAAASRFVDVHLFAFTPTREYIGDASTPAERARAARRGRLLSENDLHPLIVALGRLARDFQESLLDACADAQERDWFEDPAERSHTMLRLLQSDLLNATRPATPHPVSAGDDSIRIHACHGPMRQVEVLRDALLALFAADPTLEPRDVLVMTPDIETYAPLIQAVFGMASETAGLPAIPFRIADRSVARENTAADLAGRLLALARSRVSAPEVLDLLALGPVRERFGISADALAVVRDLVRESGIRCALDAAHRASLGLPREEQNTWWFGLERLMLGVAMRSDGRRMFSGVLPCDRAAGASRVLAALVEFFEIVSRFVEQARTPCRVSEWVARVLSVVDALAPEDDDFRQDRHRLATAMRSVCAEAEPSRALALEAFEAVFERQSVARAGAAAFFRGGVTFAEMVPLRSLPFRVIALIGLDDEAFPRESPRLAFDRIARQRKRGDHSARDDDLELFLEAVLSARDHLIITYTGQGIRDNSLLPPAVPVQQLLDTLSEDFVVMDARGATAKPEVHRRHPLQPFSPRVFCAPAYGFDRRLLRAAEVLTQPQRTEPRLRFPRRVERPDAGADARAPGIDLASLQHFFSDPPGHLLRSLGFQYKIEEETLEDDWPVTLDGLARWQAGDRLVQEAQRADEDPALLRRILQQSGILPPGKAGEIEFARLCDEARPLLARVREAASSPAREQPVEFALGAEVVRGVVPDVRDHGIVRAVFSSALGKWLLRLWIDHLAATIAVEGYTGPAMLIARAGKDVKVVLLSPLAGTQAEAQETARARLADLVGLYRAGISEPLPLFPRASFEYAKALRKDWKDQDPREAALKEAEKVWQGSQKVSGENQDSAIRLVFGEIASIADLPVTGSGSFEEIALKVFGPLLDKMEER